MPPRAPRASRIPAWLSGLGLFLLAALSPRLALASVPNFHTAATRLEESALAPLPSALEEIEQRTAEQAQCGAFCGEPMQLALRVGHSGQNPLLDTQDAWGVFRNPTAPDGPFASKNRFAFTGYVFDRETELYFARARFYDAATGRFTSQDSFLGEIDAPPSLHRYFYANANPLRYVDPTGHSPEEKYLDNLIDPSTGHLVALAHKEEVTVRALMGPADVQALIKNGQIGRQEGILRSVGANPVVQLAAEDPEFLKSTERLYWEAGAKSVAADVSAPMLHMMHGAYTNDGGEFALGFGEIALSAGGGVALGKGLGWLAEAGASRFPILRTRIGGAARPTPETAPTLSKSSNPSVVAEARTTDTASIKPLVEAPGSTGRSSNHVGRQQFDATGLTPEQVDTAILKSIRRKSGAAGTPSGKISATADQSEFILQKVTSWRRNVHASDPGYSALQSLSPELKGTFLHSSVQSRIRQLDLEGMAVNERLYGSSSYVSPNTGLPYEYRVPDFRLEGKGGTIFDIKPRGTPLAGPQYNDVRNMGATSDVRWIEYDPY